MLIRPLQESDLDQLFNEHSRQFGEEWLARQERGEVYLAIAELDGRPVGRCALDFISHQEEAAAHLWAANVSEQFRSQGIGRALFARQEEVALAHGFEVIRLEVAKDNPRARELYERIGYQQVGEEIGRWSYRQGNEMVEVTQDCFVMRKQLTPAAAAPDAGYVQKEMNDGEDKR